MRGVDWDFPQAPVLTDDEDDAIICAGRKVAPGSLTGCPQWGSAYDDSASPGADDDGEDD